MKLTLYYAPNTCATVPYITLTEAGADFEVRNINTRSGQNRSPEFLALNPKHKVPVLIIDGEPLTENVALQIWIHRRFPKARLLPADSREEIRAISLMAWCASGIHPHLTPNARPENYCDLPGSEESVKRVANKMLFEDFALADKLLAGREWFLEHFTAVDAYFFWCFRRAISFKLDLAAFRACAAHFERMQHRPSVQKVLAHEKRVMEEFARAA
ncbi:MAG TPA: glutathione S-transferase N-terminal domain-containing protein [Burkholderiales bacterium]|nr:glutathione S-transferase N-terminal domain-containing protein [Burkholderiales bacterium]